MEPVTAAMASAGISGMANLVGGLFTMSAEAKKRQRDTKLAGVQAELEAKNAAANTLNQGSQNAFNQMMQSYQGVLRR